MKTRITSSVREETYPVDPVSLREAIVNAIVHNDYAREIPPDMAEAEFYQGFSAPRNRELMRIFKDVQLVERNEVP